MKKNKNTKNNKKVSQHIRQRVKESDSQYFLKMVAVFLLGTLWLKFSQPIGGSGFMLLGIPLGFLIGIYLISRFEKDQTDRKIWYALILIVTIISMFLPMGIMI